VKILVWSKFGDSLSLARLMKEKDGNDVRLYIDAEMNKQVGDGIVEKIGDWQEYVDWADMITCDDENQGEWVEQLEDDGKVVFGTNRFGGMLENDRKYASQIMEQLGIQTIPHWEFDTLDQTIQFIKDNPERYVFKPMGQHPRYFTKVGDMVNGQDLIWFIKWLKKVWQGGQANQLQLYIEGVEVGLCAMFSRNHFVKPYELNFEHKHLRTYGQGSNIGEAGTLQLFVNESRIFDEMLKPFEKWLTKTNYCGQFDMNCKVNENGIYPMELTNRLGIPATYGYNEALNIRWTDFFYQCAKGQLKDDFATVGRFIVIVKLDVEPCPDMKQESIYNVPTDIPVIFDFDPLGVDAGFFEGDLRKDKDTNQYYLTGKQGHIGVVIGSATELAKAQDLVYKTISKIYTPFEVIFNPEIGDKYTFVEDFLKRSKII